ncbi:MAG: FHA domain-containing protein [Chloroflexi bacterium]|jgi:predicted component of type VI protein secretion system|nr:FHA domain-containing protein [Chloroflexota bacterium]
MQQCSNCGHQNRAGVVFCENCGASLIGSIPLETKALGASEEEQADLNLGSSVLTDVQLENRASFSEGDVLRLEIEGSPEPVLVKPKPETIFGRRDPATGAMPDVDLTPFAGYRMGVSRRHAAIRFGDDQALDIWDLGSSNGTFLNGQRLSAHRPYRLRDGDELRLGQMVLRVQFQTAEGAPRPAPVQPPTPPKPTEPEPAPAIDEPELPPPTVALPRLEESMPKVEQPAPAIPPPPPAAPETAAQEGDASREAEPEAAQPTQPQPAVTAPAPQKGISGEPPVTKDMAEEAASIAKEKIPPKPAAAAPPPAAQPEAEASNGQQPKPEGMKPQVDSPGSVPKTASPEDAPKPSPDAPEPPASDQDKASRAETKPSAPKPDQSGQNDKRD